MFLSRTKNPSSEETHPTLLAKPDPERSNLAVVEGVISQIKLFNAGSGWMTLTCVLVYVYMLMLLDIAITGGVILRPNFSPGVCIIIIHSMTFYILCTYNVIQRIYNNIHLDTYHDIYHTKV